MCTNVTKQCSHFNLVIDSREGSEVCLDCSLVVNSTLFISNDEYKTTPKIITSQYYEFIKDCCERMFLDNSIVEDAFHWFKEFSSQIKKEHISDKYTVAAYCIYHALKIQEIPRSLKMISYHTGASLKKLYTFEKKCLVPKPTNVYQVLTTKYTHFGLNASDLSILLKTSEHFKYKSFSPNTLAASIIHMYLTHHSISQKLKDIANIFQVTTMSIYRCTKYLKMNNFNSILRDHVCTIVKK